MKPKPCRADHRNIYGGDKDLERIGLHKPERRAGTVAEEEAAPFPDRIHSPLLRSAARLGPDVRHQTRKLRVRQLRGRRAEADPQQLSDGEVRPLVPGSPV